MSSFRGLCEALTHCARVWFLCTRGFLRRGPSGKSWSWHEELVGFQVRGLWRQMSVLSQRHCIQEDYAKVIRRKSLDSRAFCNALEHDAYSWQQDHVEIHDLDKLLLDRVWQCLFVNSTWPNDSVVWSVWFHLSRCPMHVQRPRLCEWSRRQHDIQHPPWWLSTRVDSALDVATQIDQLEDTCHVHEKLEQSLNLTFVSDFLRKHCNWTFWQQQWWVCARVFLRTESIIPRGAEWPSSTCKRDTVVLAVSRSSSVTRSEAYCSSLLSRRWVSSWMIG